MEPNIANDCWCVHRLGQLLVAAITTYLTTTYPMTTYSLFCVPQGDEEEGGKRDGLRGMGWLGTPRAIIGNADPEVVRGLQRGLEQYLTRKLVPS
eukprot:6208540-Pleurochrysis_carterae.AAC.1